MIERVRPQPGHCRPEPAPCEARLRQRHTAEARETRPARRAVPPAQTRARRRRRRSPAPGDGALPCCRRSVPGSTGSPCGPLAAIGSLRLSSIHSRMALRSMRRQTEDGSATQAAHLFAGQLGSDPQRRAALRAGELRGGCRPHAKAAPRDRRQRRRLGSAVAIEPGAKDAPRAADGPATAIQGRRASCSPDQVAARRDAGRPSVPPRRSRGSWCCSFDTRSSRRSAR